MRIHYKNDATEIEICFLFHMQNKIKVNPSKIFDKIFINIVIKTIFKILHIKFNL